MKTILIGIMAVLLLVFGYFYMLGVRSKGGSPPGLVEGRLSVCSAKPNCVCSEQATNTSHYVSSLAMPQQAIDSSMQQLVEEIEVAGGVVVMKQEAYLAATFTSSLMRYVDDLEVRIDAAENKVHFRSASRVGHSDFGVNRKRIEQLQAALIARGWQ
ncbi:MAG: DUF1499 domain-containing protein [Amphritea sp.]